MNKIDILSNPSKYSWNYILYHIQFTQDEIISVKDWITIEELIKYQKSITRSFLEEHFTKEINSSLEVDWDDVKKYVSVR